MRGTPPELKIKVVMSKVVFKGLPTEGVQGQPVGHSVGHPRFRGHSQGHSPGHSSHFTIHPKFLE